MGMKKLFAIALSLVLVLSLAGGALAQTKLEKIKAEGKITMATSPDFAPSEFIDPNKTGQEAIVGADISLAKYIAEQLGVTLTIEAMDFSAALGAAATGAVDIAISGFAPTEERKEAMLLSDPFVYEADAGQGILVLKDQADNYKKTEDFAGKKIAVQNGSLQYKLLTEQLPEAVPEIITNLNDAVMMLITGKVDAVGVSVDNGLSFVNNYDELAVSEFRYDYASVGTVVAMQKGQDDLAAAINEILAKAKEEGLFPIWFQEAKALADSLGIE